MKLSSQMLRNTLLYCLVGRLLCPESALIVFDFGLFVADNPASGSTQFGVPAESQF